MAGMPRISGLLLKKAGTSSVPAVQQVKNFSFTVTGQDTAKTNSDAISRQYPVVSPAQTPGQQALTNSTTCRLTTPMTLLWLVLEAPVFVQPSVW